MLDFDETVTEPKKDTFSWIRNREGVTLAEKMALEANEQRFLKKCQAGLLTSEEALEWFESEIDIWLRYGLTEVQVYGAMSTIPFREDTLELMWTARELGMKTAVVSYGVRNFIEAALVCKGFEDVVDAVYALRLETEDGQYRGYDLATIVTPETKGEASRRFADRYGIPHNRIFAIGDSLGDKLLGHLPENRLFIPGTHVAQKKLLAMAQYGHVIQTNTARPAIDWLRAKLGGED